VREVLQAAGSQVSGFVRIEVGAQA
jgi:hypothetical protein